MHEGYWGLTEKLFKKFARPLIYLSAFAEDHGC